MCQMEEHFVSNIDPNDHYLDVLNWYRNLYYTENVDTERGIMSRAINDLFMDLKNRVAEDRFYTLLKD